MAVYKQKDSKNWWYKFVWRGEPVRESTKQTNKTVAEQMEAAPCATSIWRELMLKRSYARFASE
jgi:hypothetical protein